MKKIIFNVKSRLITISIRKFKNLRKFFLYKTYVLLVKNSFLCITKSMFLLYKFILNSILILCKKFLLQKNTIYVENLNSFPGKIRSTYKCKSKGRLNLIQKKQISVVASFLLKN